MCRVKSANRGVIPLSSPNREERIAMGITARAVAAISAVGRSDQLRPQA
jgi:hypothetical protein